MCRSASQAFTLTHIQTVGHVPKREAVTPATSLHLSSLVSVQFQLFSRFNQAFYSPSRNYQKSKLANGAHFLVNLFWGNILVS